MHRNLRIGSDCAGVGAFPQSLRRLNYNFTEEFACDFDYFARLTYVKNYGTADDLELALSKEHKKFAEAVKKIALADKDPTTADNIILHDANEFAKKFSFYFPFNMYQREIPTKPLDIYVGSFPCQSFSLSGKRKGEEDKRGILFYCGHDFIKQNKPRYFIIENVKGLLSDDNGKTFQRWIDYLGGKSVNGTQTMFPHEEAVPYHIYYQVLNAKDYGIPQNRERIFIIGIRDDSDNNFTFPKPFPLVKRLKDILETNVDEKYFLSDKMIESFTLHKDRHKEKGTGFQWKPKDVNDTANCIRANAAICPTDNTIIVGDLNKGGERGSVFSTESPIMSCLTATDFKQPKQIYVKSATSKGFELARLGEDSINFEHPNSKTRRGRVGVGVGQTLTTSCNQGVAINIVGNLPSNHEQNSRIYGIDGISPTLTTMQGVGQEPKVAIGAIRGRNPDNPTSRQSGLPTQQMLEVNESGTPNCLTTVQKDNVVVELRTDEGIRYFKDGLCGTIRTKDAGGDKCVIEPIIQRIGNYSKSNHNASSIVSNQGIALTVMENHGTVTAVSTHDYRIRKLTPRECFNLMDFPDTFDFSVVSDSQAYKQAGNSICVGVLAQLISKLNL